MVGPHQVRGDGTGPDTAYDVTARNGEGMTRRRKVGEYASSRRLNAVATTFQSIDVHEVGDGETLAGYHGTLQVLFSLWISDPLLGRPLNKIGDEAATNPAPALRGTFEW